MAPGQWVWYYGTYGSHSAIFLWNSSSRCKFLYTGRSKTNFIFENILNVLYLDNENIRLHVMVFSIWTSSHIATTCTQLFCHEENPIPGTKVAYDQMLCYDPKPISFGQSSHLKTVRNVSLGPSLVMEIFFLTS